MRKRKVKKFSAVGLCGCCKLSKPASDFWKDQSRGNGLCSNCKNCMNLKNRERYQRNKDKYRPRIAKSARKYSTIRSRQNWKKFPEKIKAHNILHYWIKNGKVVKLPCRDCGNKKSEGHHPDYSKPLEVIWLCSLHHKAEHGRGYKPVSLPPNKKRGGK